MKQMMDERRSSPRKSFGKEKKIYRTRRVLLPQRIRSEMEELHNRKAVERATTMSEYSGRAHQV